MAFLELTRRLPNEKESRLFNAMVVTLVEHGITLSASRTTYLRPAMQAAVAAGLSGLGSVFVGSMEGVARMLSENADVDQMKRVPGLGHPLHKPVDPRTVRPDRARNRLLWEVLRAHGRDRAQENLVVNATGAIGALACELGLDWRAVKGLGVMARAIGLVGHLLEEARQPMAEAVWHQIEEQASKHLKP